MKTVVYNLGCKVNQCECDSLIASLKAMGHEVSAEMVCADNYIINTCAVTKEAERKSRQFIGKAFSLNKNANVYVIGCASEKNPNQFENRGVRYVAGNAAKSKVLEFLSGTHIEPLPTIYENMHLCENFRARAYVKIEDGCNNFCSYCIIPYLRGRCRSKAIEDVVAECKSYSVSAKEIVLTGINTSAYGKDIGLSLIDLINALSKIETRFRFGSLEVGVVTDEFVSALASAGNFCPHFHLSLQSGSDSVLTAMNRHYTADEYAEKVDIIRSYFPSAAITTDIIVGFPAENDENFLETIEFVKRIGFANVHIFPYSRRAGTAAYPLGELNSSLVKGRLDALRSVKNEMKKEYESSFVGAELDVLIESNDGIIAEGYSQNYIRVYIIANCNLQIGQIYTVVVDRERADGVEAHLKY